jgi:hypothetical protein
MSTDCDVLTDIIKLQFAYMNGIDYINTQHYHGAIDHLECAVRNINKVLPMIVQDTVIYPGLTRLKQNIANDILRIQSLIKEKEQQDKQKEVEKEEYIVYEQPNTFISFLTDLMPCIFNKPVKDETKFDLYYKIMLLERKIKQMEKEKQD